MKYELVTTAKFRKDLKRIKKRGLPCKELQWVLGELLAGHTLSAEYHDHGLSGNYAGVRECHVRPDWLLLYMVSDEILVLTALRTGSHSDLL